MTHFHTPDELRQFARPRISEVRLFWICLGLLLAACVIALALAPAGSPEPGYPPATSLRSTP